MNKRLNKNQSICKNYTGYLLFTSFSVASKFIKLIKGLNIPYEQQTEFNDSLNP